jgi:hypothetical protein
MLPVIFLYNGNDKTYLFPDGNVEWITAVGVKWEKAQH